MHNPLKVFERLLQIMDELREKCPWDRKQTTHTLRSMTIEEVYELADAITRNDWQNMKEELGDILLHVIFYARIANEQSQFNIADVIETLSNKLIIRHPHIYSDVIVNNEEDVKRNWEKIKLQQSKKSTLSGVPVALPAMIKAARIQEKAKQVGFEWENKEDVFAKVEEEINELKIAVKSDNEKEIDEEFGDVLFSLINYARFLHIDAEASLEKINKKFIYRFTRMEEMAASQNKNLTEMSLHEMDELWNKIKSEKIDR